MAFSYQFDAVTDPEDGTVAYTAALSNGNSLPSWLRFDAGTRTFSGTPTSGSAGTLTIRVTASDGESPPATSQATFTLTVTALVDYDDDDDGLIEVDSLAQLNAMRYDLDGNGAATTRATRPRTPPRSPTQRMAWAARRAVVPATS